MGYYTEYTLDIIDKNYKYNEEEILHELEIISEYSDQFLEPIKWYEHEENMLKLSRRYPDIVFKLKGIGEEFPDIWIKYFKNGKMQKCIAKIMFDDYDESKLE